MLTGLESMCEIQWAGAKRGSICCDARITFSFTLTGCLYPSMLHHAAHLLFFYLTGHCWLEILYVYVYVCVYTYEWLLMHHLLAIYPPSQAFGASFFFFSPPPQPHLWSWLHISSLDWPLTHCVTGDRGRGDVRPLPVAASAGKRCDTCPGSQGYIKT